MAEYDITIERKSESKLYFNLCDSRGRPARAKGAFRMEQFPQLAIKMQQGDTQHSDREPPYASREQLDFSGGRAWDDFERDKTRFLDSYRAQTWYENVVILGPEERYCDGIRLGDDEATNGGFDADSDWTKGTGWSIGSGVATCDGSQVAASNLVQTVGKLDDGIVYRITYTVSDYAAGNVTVYAGATSPGTARSADGTYTEYLTCSGTNQLFISGDADFPGSIDNVIVEAFEDMIEHWWQDNADSDDDIERVILTDDTEYHAVQFEAPCDITIESVQLALGCDYQNTFYEVAISIYSDSGNAPDSELATTGALQPDVYEHIETFEFSSSVTLVEGTDYHLVVRNYMPAAVSDQGDGYYVIAAHSGSAVVNKSSDGSSWSYGSYPILYRLLPANQDFEIFPFEHLGCLYMALSFRDGGDPRIYRNGERGTATSGASSTITDSGASWIVDGLIGSLIVIYAGKGSDTDRPWREITDNTATVITVGEAWDEAPDETTKYAVIQSNVFTEVLDHGMTGRITDVFTFGNIVYFCRGDFLDIYHMYDDEFDIEPGNRGTFMQSGPDSTDNSTKIYLARASYPTTIFTADPEFMDEGWTLQDLEFEETVDIGDPSCEEDDGSWADYNGPTLNNLDSSPVIDGHYSRAINGDGDGKGVSQTITTVANARYRVEAWIRGYAGEVRLEFDGDDVATTDNTGSWIHIYGYNTASADTATLRILCKDGAAAFNFDAVKVTRVDTVLPSGHDKITGLVVAGNPKRLFVMTSTGILRESDGAFLDVSPGEFQNVRDYRNGAVSNNKGDYIYTTFLNEVIKYYDEEIAVLGPNLDMGLPEGRRGTISSLVTYGDWLLAAVDGGDDNVSSILLHNGQGWHEYYRAPAAGLRITTLFIQAVPGEYLDRLWFNEGGDIVWLGIDRDPLYNSRYRYTFAGWIDQATIYGSMGEVEKFFQSVKATSLTNSAENYVSVQPRDTDGYSKGGDVPTGETYETLWGILDDSPVDENSIDEFWSMETFTLERLQIHIGLHNTYAKGTPDLRSIVVDFIEHVPVQWSYTFRLITADSRRSLTGEPAYDLIETDLATLRSYVNSAEPVRIYTPFSYATGLLCKLISVSDFEPAGYRVRGDQERTMFVLAAVGV